MGSRLLLMLVAVLMPVAASAQDGLRSASLPESRLSPSLMPQPRDVFRSRPGTYRPGPHRLPIPLYGYPGPDIPYPLVQPIVVVVPMESLDPGRVAPPPVAPAPPPPPYVAGTPGRPKTFYVIPGCYAGDRRPDPESLAPGCSLSRLRVIPPS